MSSIDCTLNPTNESRKQVNRFLSALSTLQQPVAPPSPLSRRSSVAPRNLPPASSISIHSSSRHFDSFMKSINKLKSLGEARRLRADVERELRNIALVAVDQSNESEARSKRKYEQRLERARLHIDERISVLSGLSQKVSRTSITLLIISHRVSCRLISQHRISRQTSTCIAFYPIPRPWHTIWSLWKDDHDLASSNFGLLSRASRIHWKLSADTLPWRAQLKDWQMTRNSARTQQWLKTSRSSTWRISQIKNIP